jgi:MFS family permease
MAQPVYIEESAASELEPDDGRPWYKRLNRYHWFVFVVAALGWLFDCFDQQIFNLARPAAMESLIPKDTPNRGVAVQQYGGYATSLFLIGWACGGLFFGVLGDRWGRAKTMLVTILMYSVFTGLSSLSVGFWDFAVYRLLTGLGVGGEFAVGVALLAETMPSKARPYTLAALQALSAVGNVMAASTFIAFGLWEQAGHTTPIDSWRMMFLIGAIPALLALVIRRGLKEPEKWRQAKAASRGEAPAQQQPPAGRGFEPVVPSPVGNGDEAAIAAATPADTLADHNAPKVATAPAPRMGSYSALFSNATWRKHALLGLVLAFSGVVGLWGVGFFTPDLMRLVQRPAVAMKVYAAEAQAATAAGDAALAAQFNALHERVEQRTKGDLPPDLKPAADKAESKIRGELKIMGGVTSLMINVGAFCGMFGFGYLSQRIGRKPTFAIAFTCAGLSTAAVFLFLNDFSQLFWMVPAMCFFQLALFSGYAIYFPELFPTHLRSTGTSFCYNVGRFVAASGPLLQAQLIGLFAGGAAVTSLADDPANLRRAGATMCLVFVVGLLALPFLPETRGRALPE